MHQVSALSFSTESMAMSI